MKSLIKKNGRKLNRSVKGNVVMFILLAVVGCFMAIPLVYTVNNAFKPLDELFMFPPKFFVRNPTLNNFYDLGVLMSTSWIPFSRYVFNTFFITIFGVLGHVIIASAAAYPMAKHDFKGKNVLFGIVVLSLMFSPAVTAIPNYIIISALGINNSYGAVIFPAFASSLGLYLMKQFMEQIPDSLIESAQIDGATEYRVFWNIIMPNVKPAWLTLTILMFQSLWVTTGGIFLRSEQLKPLNYALNQIVQGGVARAGASSSVGFILMIVPVTLFVFSQSRIIETMASSGMKE